MTETSGEVPFTFEQLLTLRHLSDVQLSADGGQLAFVASSIATATDRESGSRIHSGPTAGQIRQITRGPGSDSLPRFSPDASRLAFASDRDHLGRATLFVLNPGAEAMPVGEIAGSIEDIRWLDDAEIVVLAADAGPDLSAIGGARKASDEPNMDPIVRRSPEIWRRLYRINSVSGETTEVKLGEQLTVWEFSLDRERAVAVVSEDPSDGGWYHGRIATIDLETGEIVALYTPEFQVECPRISPDHRWLAWTENICSDRGFTAGTVNVLHIDSGERRELATETDVTELEWIDEFTLRVCGPRGTHAVVGLVGLKDGEFREVFAGPVRLGSAHHPAVTADASGALFAAVREAPGVPPEVALLDISNTDAGWREVSALNVHLRDLAVPDVEEIAWESNDGLEIAGLLVRPSGVEGPLPMIVTIHGGPTACWEWAFSPGYWYTAQIFTEAGYALLLPNPRGSSGRGREFARANVGDVGGGDFRDILAGVDACVERGIADEDRIGAWGMSYGGFMSCWLVGNTDRFKAIVPVACHSNWLSFHNTSTIPAFDRMFVDASPYEAEGSYFHLSPVAHAPKATTPTLFLHGACDHICPLSQAEEMYRAIGEAGCKTELVIYPGAGHYLTAERAHAIDAIRRLLDWMNQHLRGDEAGMRT